MPLVLGLKVTRIEGSFVAQGDHAVVAAGNHGADGARLYGQGALALEQAQHPRGVALDEVDSRSRRLATQLLYSYKVNPQTVLFLGYSDAAEDGDELSAFETTGRTLFAKVGYAWLP